MEGLKKVLLYQILVFTIQGKTLKKPHNYNKFKISTSTWNDDFELPDESYLVSDIQDYFEYIHKNIMKILIILQ